MSQGHGNLKAHSMIAEVGDTCSGFYPCVFVVLVLWTSATAPLSVGQECGLDSQEKSN